MGPVDMVLEKIEQRCREWASVAESTRVGASKRVLTESEAVESSSSTAVAMKLKPAAILMMYVVLLLLRW